MRDRIRAASPYALAGLLTVTGALHFAVARYYDRIVPPVLGAPRAWTYASGAAELACAAGLASRRTRRAGATATAALFVAVFPANVYMAIEPGSAPRWAAIARLPVQLPLVWWALAVRRDAHSSKRRSGDGADQDG